MKQEINPKDTSRAQAFELWMKAPNPMVTFFKTVDVTHAPEGFWPIYRMRSIGYTAERQRKFDLRQAKKKEKHRGH